MISPEVNLMYSMRAGYGWQAVVRAYAHCLNLRKSTFVLF